MNNPCASHSRIASEDEQLYLLDQLLYFFPGPYAMLSAFVDESGNDGVSPAFCVAGFLYGKTNLKQLDREWKKSLRAFGVSHFHTKDCAHLRGEFQGMDRSKADDLYIRLLGLIRQYSCGASAIYTLPEDKFKQVPGNKMEYSQYTLAAHFCIQQLRNIAHDMGHNKVSFFIEAGHPRMGELSSLIIRLHEYGQFPGARPAFVFKDSMRALQTADVLAYEMSKHVRNRVYSPERPVRKSLQSLIVNAKNQRVLTLNAERIQRFYVGMDEMMERL